VVSRAGDILLLHDGHAARTASGTPVVLDVLPRCSSAIAERGPASRSRCAPRFD
jgi:peptidoglycan-N-acetylglucosamine deacetylase